MTKEELFQSAKSYYLEIQRDMKVLEKLYPELKKKQFKMSDKGRKNISAGMRAYYRDKKAAEKANGKKS